MSEEKDKNIGFLGIGKRIENLKDDISTEDTVAWKQETKTETPRQTKADSTKKQSPPKREIYKQKAGLPFRLSFAKVFWGVIAIVIIASMFSQNNDKKKTTYTPSSSAPTQRSVPSSFDDDIVTDGQYRCSRYHYNRGEELKPSAYEKQSIEIENNALTSLKIEIETTYVDHSSQSSIDHYNMIVNDYNLRLELHRLNVASYNNKVETYNNYLMSNCRKAY